MLLIQDNPIRKYTRPHILAFLLRSKYRETFDSKVDRTKKTDLNLTGSVPCEIIDPDTKQVTRLSIGIPPQIHRALDTTDQDTDAFIAAMRVINE